MKEKLCAIKTRVALNPYNTYAYIETSGNGLNSELSPIRIKSLCKILIHEAKDCEHLNNIVVAMLLKQSGLIIAHRFILKMPKQEIFLSTTSSGTNKGKSHNHH